MCSVVPLSCGCRTGLPVVSLSKAGEVMTCSYGFLVWWWRMAGRRDRAGVVSKFWLAEDGVQGGCARGEFLDDVL